MKNKWTALGYYLLASLPAIYLAHLLTAYHLDLPLCDQWVHVDLIQRLFDHKISWADVWQQQDDFRMPIQRLAVLAMAYASHWNIAVELAANLLAGITALLMIGILIRRTEAANGLQSQAWILTIISVLVLTLIQYENWFWGFALNLYIGNLAFITVVVLLSNQEFRWWRYAASVLAGCVATFSVHYGLMSWPLGLMILVAMNVSSLQKNWVRAGLWGLIGILVVIIYFYGLYFRGLAKLAISPGPIDYLSFVLNFLALPLSNDRVAPIVGFIGLILLTTLPIWLVVTRRMSIQSVIPYVSIGLYSVGGAVAASIGRVPLGSTGDSLRYSSVSIWMWVAIIALLYFSIRSEYKDSGRTNPISFEWAGLIALCVLLFAIIDPLNILSWRVPNEILVWLLCGIGVGAYVILSSRIKIQYNIATHASSIALIVISILLTHQSFGVGKRGAIWYQKHHFAPIVNQVVDSSLKGKINESALTRLYCGIPVQIENAKTRIKVLREYNLAAFRD